MLKYLSVLEVEQPATVQEVLRFSIELDDYERVTDDPEEYGKQVLERIGANEELISTLDGFTDFEAMGNFYMREDGVRRTEFGLLRKLSDPFPEVQDVGWGRCLIPVRRYKIRWNQHEWEKHCEYGRD